MKNKLTLEPRVDPKISIFLITNDMKDIMSDSQPIDRKLLPKIRIRPCGDDSLLNILISAILAQKDLGQTGVRILDDVPAYFEKERAGHSGEVLEA